MLTRRPARSVTLSTLLAGAALAAAPAAPGVSFTMRTTPRGAESDGAGSTTRVRVQGDAMRFDADPATARSDDATSSPGVYTLLDGAGRRVVVVMPERKQFMEIRFDDTTTQALMAAMAVTTTVTDVQVKGESLGGGEAVNGMPTRRYRLTTDYTYRAGGDAATASPGKTHVVEDYWVSDRLAGVTDPLEQMGRAMGARGGFGASPFAAVSASSVGGLLEKRAAAQRRLFEGMPVRTVTATTDVAPDGERTESGSTTEVADVVRGDLDPSLFRVPDGYTKFDMKELMNVSAQMKAALRGRAGEAGAAAADTTSMLGAAKEGATAGAKEGLREGAREAAGRKIRGIFKRP